MKRILKLAVLTVVVCCVAGPALANIPAHVDFWAEQTVPGTTDVWTIHEEAGFNYNRYTYDLPVWDGNILKVDNQYVEDNTKYLWVEIWFTDDAEGKVLEDPIVIASGNITGYGVENIDGDATWSWTIFPQPAEEWVNFTSWIDVDAGGSMASFDLDGNGILDISKIEVGTYCVPTPPAVVLCLIGVAFAGIAGRFRRRK